MCLGWWMQVWLGYQQSLRPTQGGLSLNLDTAATAFLEEQPLIQYLMRSLGLFNEQGLINITQDLFKKANRALSNIKVGSMGSALKFLDH